MCRGCRRCLVCPHTVEVFDPLFSYFSIFCYNILFLHTIITASYTILLLLLRVHGMLLTMCSRVCTNRLRLQGSTSSRGNVNYCTRMSTACDCRLDDAVVVTLMLLLGSTAFPRRRKYCRLIKRYRSLSVDRESYPIGKDTLADYKCNIKHYL
jgi:hypothetical protein